MAVEEPTWLTFGIIGAEYQESVAQVMRPGSSPPSSLINLSWLEALAIPIRRKMENTDFIISEFNRNRLNVWGAQKTEKISVSLLFSFYLGSPPWFCPYLKNCRPFIFFCAIIIKMQYSFYSIFHKISLRLTEGPL